MNEIDLPGAKEKLWHAMRADLQSLVPWFADNELLLCPACCRALRFDDFSLEHIIPQQALDDDTVDVRAAIPRNERSGLTLLCRRPLIVNGKPIKGHGCNSWKGRYYDKFMWQLLRMNGASPEMNSRHQMALFATGYLALLSKFGYQVALLSSGLLMRRQFFHPNSFLDQIPHNCQMLLMGQGPQDFAENTRSFWSDPFRFTLESNSVLVLVRNLSFRLPLSRDPTMPLARALRYAPPKYIFRPDLTTVFD